MTQQKHKVLFAIGSLSGGGAERQIITILKHLDRSIFEPMLYLLHKQGDLLDQVPADVPIYAFDPMAASSRFYLPGRLHHRKVQHLSQVLLQQQIDLVYDRTYHTTLIAAPATRKTGTPRISVIVSEPALNFADNREIFLWIKKHLLRKAYLQANAVITVSQCLAKRVCEYYRLPDQQIVPIFNCYDFAAIAGQAQEYEPFLATEHFHIVAAGRLSPEKNYPMLIEAVKILSDQKYDQLQLHILGQGPQESQLRALVKSFHLNERVHLRGFVANPFPWYRHAQLSCLCSNYEGLPNMLIEAMACGTPVIATDCQCGPAEILAGGQFGALVPVNDAAALAQKIAEAINHDALWQQRAERAKTHVEITYSIPKHIGQLQNLMLQILS